MTLTFESLQTTLAERFGGVLKSGCHGDECGVCVRELRAAMLELPWSDHPDGHISSLTDTVCQRLNDAAWSSDAMRTRYCLPLALLSEATAAPGWRDAYILQTIRVSVAGAFRAAASIHPIQEHKNALNANAEMLSQVAWSAAESAAQSAESAAWSAAQSAAWSAAWSAAQSAQSAQSAAQSAWSAAWSAAESAAWSAAESAQSAAWSAAQDKALIEAVGIFIAAQGNPEAQAAWDSIMAEDAQRAADAAKGE